MSYVSLTLIVSNSDYPRVSEMLLKKINDGSVTSVNVQSIGVNTFESEFPIRFAYQIDVQITPNRNVMATACAALLFDGDIELAKRIADL